MKKILILFTFLILLVVVGCKKDEDPTITTINVVVPEHEINPGDSCQVTVSIQNGSGELSSNLPGITGIELKNGAGTKTYWTHPLEVTTDYWFRLSNGTEVIASTSRTINVKVVHPPTLNITFTYNGLPVDTLPFLGGSVNIVVDFANGQLFCNGVSYGFFGPVSFDLNITETTPFDFKVIGATSTVTKSIVVPVRLSTNQELLIWNTDWKLTEQYTTCEAKAIYHRRDNLSECELNGTWTFYSDYTLKRYDPCTSQIPYSGTYSISGDSIYIGHPYLKKELTSDRLIWETVSTWTIWSEELQKWIDAPMIIEQVFVHSNKK